MKKILLLVLSLFSINTFLTAQCFTGGTGSDGGYLASVNTTLPGATYNFTSFTIDPGVTVTVTGSQPLVIYCTGSATINGILDASGGNGSDGVTYTSGGPGGIAVAGGNNGGAGSFASGAGPLNGVDGTGTGGGTTAGQGWSGGGGAGYATSGLASGGVGGFGGPSYGDMNISGLETGSGGGGGSGGYDCGAGGGGAGGGIIIINAAVSITISATGIIRSNGGNGGSDGTGNCGGGGGGSGGSLWIATPSLTHNGMLEATGGIGGASAVSGSPYYGGGATGSEGRVRMDYNGAMAGSGTSNPGVGSTFTVGTIVNSQSATLCSGQSLVVGTSIYTATGMYTDILTAANGCDSTVNSNLTVNPLPNVATTTTGGTISASLSGAISYQWIICPGFTNATGTSTAQSYTPSVNGSYAVIVNDGLCSDTSACVVMSTVGINELGNNTSLSVYPNPSNGVFTVGSTTEGSFLIVNELGQIIQTVKLTANNNFNANIEGLNNGMYFLVGVDNAVRQKILVTK